MHDSEVDAMSTPNTLGRLDQLTTNTVIALFDTVVPPSEDAPGGWEGGGRVLLNAQLAGFLASYGAVLEAAAQRVDQASAALRSVRFDELDAHDRADVLAEALHAEARPEVEDANLSETPVSAMIDLVHQAFYGGTVEPAGWALARFQPLPDGIEPVEPDRLEGISVDDVVDGYDVVVIGAGAGGGFAAAELVRQGKHVLLMERSRPFFNAELRGNHLQGKRQELYAVTAGPGAGSPRVLEREDGSTISLDGNGSGTAYGLNAMALGGGTRVWQAMAWRFLPEDFMMASIYGSPAGSTLVDWPFGYDDLEPYYERVEWSLGVSGQKGSSATTRAPRVRDLPMPTLRDNGLRQTYREAADRLGWEATPIPFAINSVPRAGRPACIACGQCVGHACPVNAKNGTHNTVIPEALATGRCDLIMSTQVCEILHDPAGKAAGVRAFHEKDGVVREVTVRAGSVVVAAGPIETPRLLLASGLGNEWVGRNHHTHAGAAAYTTEAPFRRDYTGPGHSVATLDFVHRGDAPWGGGVIFDFPPMLPVARARLGRSIAAQFGAEHTGWMRDSSVPLGTMSMVQEVPHELSRVSLDPRVRDRYGMPVARLRGQAHPASAAAAEFMRERCHEWVVELGGRGVYSEAYPGGSRGAEHSAGTARLGNDPAHAACDPQGRLFGTSNVYVADASLHPTNGGFNPGLTAMANALRVASLMA